MSSLCASHERTVRRSAGKVHINAQLVDARTDTHIWAEQYNRDLNDVFAIESEVAQSIASRLRAKVSAREKAAMQEWPTRNLVAYDLYTRANDMTSATQADMRDLAVLTAQRIDLLNQAVARDPSFLQAYCKLAFAHDQFYWLEYDRTPARLAMSEAVIQKAFRIRPNGGEAHYAQAEHLYRGYRDFDRAPAELEVARQTLPNHASIFEMMGFIQRRQGRWEESTRNLERAAELDPRDIETLKNVAANYAGALGRFAEAKSWAPRVAAIAGPDDVWRN